MALGLVRDVLNPVDVMEVGNVQNIIDTETVGAEGAGRPHLVADDWKKRVFTGIWGDNDINFAFKSPKTGTLPVAPRPYLSCVRRYSFQRL